MSPDGAPHALDLDYVFGNFVRGGRPRPEDQELSDLMQAYWVHFARTGNPDGEGLAAWPEFTFSNQNVMELDSTTCGAAPAQSKAARSAGRVLLVAATASGGFGPVVYVFTGILFAAH